MTDRFAHQPKLFVLFVISFLIFLIFFCYINDFKLLGDNKFSNKFGPKDTFENKPKLLVWPEEDSSDRILAQLLLTAPDDAPVKTIYVTEGHFDVSYGDDFFVKSDCNVKKCSFTNDKAHADAVLFKHSVKENRKNVSPNQIWILYTQESPYHEGKVSVEGVVNWTATYRRDSDIVASYAKWVYDDDNIRINNITKNYAEGKTKKVAQFVSNCHAQNQRSEYARELSKYIDVDIYGSCGTKHCTRFVENCFDLLQKDYKFYLAFENSNCRDYITEKYYLNSLESNIIPIVMGAHPDDFQVFGPEHSYIHVDSFESPKELASYLLMLDEFDDLYNSYFKWKGTGKQIDTKFFCRLCALLHTPRSPKYYPNFKEWWSGGDVCTRGRWIN